MPVPSARRRSPRRSWAWLPRAVASFSVFLGACLASSAAGAAEPARLEWVRLEGGGSCIDAAELEARVKRRLGSDPFDPKALRSIEGIVERSGHLWRAEIAVRARPNDANPPRRVLESPADDCESLSNAVVLAVALAIDPAAAFNDAAVKAPAPPGPADAQKPPPSEPRRAAAHAALPGRAELALVSQLGLLPKASFGLSLGVATAISERFELDLRAQAFPEVEVSGEPSYAAGGAALTLELCGALSPSQLVDLRLCGGPSLGLLHASVLAGDRTQPGERPWLAADLGVDTALALTSALGFYIGARAAVPVTRYRFTLESSDGALFTQSVVAGIASAGFELRFGAQP